MDRFKNMFKPKQSPQEQLRDWQRRLRLEYRKIDRQIRNFQKEQNRGQKAIVEAVRRNNLVSAKAHAKEIVRSRKAVIRLHKNMTQMNSIAMHIGESAAMARTMGYLPKSPEIMKLVINLMKAPEVTARMQEFRKEMVKAGVIEEAVNDAADTTPDSEDVEEETEEEINKVLLEIMGATASQLSESVRKDRERVRQSLEVVTGTAEGKALAKEASEEEVLESIKAWQAEPTGSLALQGFKPSLPMFM